MLVIMTQEQLQKFPRPQYDYTDPENPVLTSSPTFTFNLLAQNMGDYRVCGTIEGTTTDFVNAGITQAEVDVIMETNEGEPIEEQIVIDSAKMVYTEVTDIPDGYSQRVLPGEYTGNLKLADIEKYQKFEEQKHGGIVNTLQAISDMQLALASLMGMEV